LSLRGLFLLQHLHAIGEGCPGGHAPEIAEYFLRLHRNIFEQKNFPGKLQPHARDQPRSVPNIFLLDEKMTPFVEMPQNSPAKRDLLEECSVNSGDPARLGIDQQNSCHAGQHVFHTRRRVI